MKYIRKVLSVFLIIIILSTLTITTTSASLKTIYENSTIETITSGATLEKITRFTDDGWLSMNVLRVDLSNQNIKIDSLSNSDSIKNLTTTQSLAQSQGAVAAINGGFFSWIAGSNGIGTAIGPVMESGKIVAASNSFNQEGDIMATLSIDTFNKALCNYWRTKISLVTSNLVPIDISQYNKPSKDYTDFTIIDRRWGKNSLGASNTYPDLVEMVVVEGIVKEIRQAQPALEIPSNGYIVVTRQNGGNIINNNLTVGDRVSMDITSNPDWNSMKMAITGGAVLLKDGNIPSRFSLDSPGRNPRTAIGSNKTGSQLIMVTVDGRLGNSIGMTLTELAQFMTELGAYNALNLDGGGSTTMVSRTPGTNDLSLVNTPSDGSQRKISTAVGIFSIAPPSELDGLIIDTEDTNVFVNTSRSFTVRGYDKYFNPIEVAPDQIKWSASGISGTFKGNTFYPTSYGSGKIKATVGKVTKEIEISSLSSPVQMTLNVKSLNLPLNSTKSFTIMGKNRNGYYATINPENVKWVVHGNIGTFTKDTFTAAKQGTGYIDASVGSTHAYCTVSVEIETTVYTDKFEAANASFTSYPQTVTGSYGLSTEQQHSDKMSGKLAYDFSNNIQNNRAAYMVLANGGIPLNKNTKKIGVWVYNTHQNTNWLGAWVYDAKGSQNLVYFSKTMDWTGWKYLEASLQDINSPSKLSRIHLVQVNPVPDSGCIYLDDMSVVTSSYPVVDMSKIPQDTVPVDEASKSGAASNKTAKNFRFSVFGQSHEPKNPLESLLMTKLSDKVNKYLEASALVGSSAHEINKLIKKPSVSTNTGYKTFDILNSRFIQLDMSKQGLRTTNTAEWHWFLQQLDSAKGNNIFIFLANSPTTFKDSLEANAFQDILTKYKQKTGKTVWLFYNGDKNTSYMERGIKYISSAGFDVTGLTTTNTNAAKYVLVVVNETGVTFEFKPII